LSKLNLSKSLTELPFNKIFFKLAIPNVCATFFAATTVIFDLWYIGKIGISELAGVAYIFPIYMLTSMLSNGAFGGAVSGATARAFGSKNITQAECIFRSAILIALLGAIILMFLFFSFSEKFLIYYKVDKQVSLSAITYGNILLKGIFLIWLFNIIISVTRGSGNTTIPAISWLIVLFFHILFATLNFNFDDRNIILTNSVTLLNGMFLFTSLEWSAISLLSGYLAGIIFILGFYFFGNHSYSLKFQDIFKLRGFFKLIKSGSLASCQSLMTISLALFCTTIIGNFGTNWTAGFGIAIRLELLLIPIIFGIGGALIAIVGANVGANKFQRAIQMTWKGTSFSVVIVGVIGLFFSIYPELWSGLFTSDLQTKVTAKAYLNLVAPFYAFFALGLGLYFVCQAFNTLFWPVVGTFLRLFYVVILTLILFYNNLASPYLLFFTMSSSLIIYGLFISLSLHFGPWKLYYKEN
tara:strand:- start:978 stop:2381 length:1404 start_codon:yes stop_codon:yes gene_type:complete